MDGKKTNQDFWNLKLSLAVLFSCSFVATGAAALLKSFKKTLHKTSSRVIKERTQLV